MTTPLNTPMPPLGFRWTHTYRALGDDFSQSALPAVPAQPRLIVFNIALADELGLHSERLNSPQGAELLSGGAVPQDAAPIAQAYAGHQFGGFTMLGDGRAILLGEHNVFQGPRVDVQLKGAGRTAYSRGGDGRAALGPMLREHLMAHAMHALRIPTTRSLAVVATGEPVMRVTPLRGAVLTRIADSHLRVGTFEYAARFLGAAGLKQLADYTIARHFPDIGDAAPPCRALWHATAARQAELVARWMGVGFVHGVMNTDNVSIAGQTLDYGPCAFLDAYDPATVFSSIDHHGRYAYGNQPSITHWNLARLAEALLPLLGDDPNDALAWARDAVNGFPDTFREAWLGVMRRKLGLLDARREDDALISDLLAWMHAHGTDFTNTFRSLMQMLAGVPDDCAFASSPEFVAWHARWSRRRSLPLHNTDASRSLMLAHNPAYIPRNHRVEAALRSAVEHEDMSHYDRLLAVLAKPYDDQPKHTDLRDPAPNTEPPYRTYCGT